MENEQSILCVNNVVEGKGIKISSSKFKEKLVSENENNALTLDDNKKLFVQEKVGDLSELETTIKDNIVGAVNNLQEQINELPTQADLDNKQDTLVSGVNLKTIGHQSLLGEGDIEIEVGSAAWGDIFGNIENQRDLMNKLNKKQEADLLPSWNRTAFPALGVTWEAMAYGGGVFVALGRKTDGTTLAISSDDGVTWLQRDYSDTSIWYDIAYNDGKFVAVGSGGACTYTTDGVIWHYVAPPTLYDLHGITYGDGKFVAVGYNGTCISSSDGITWERKSTGVTETFRDIAYGYDGTTKTFVAVGDDGRVCYSHDLTSWTTTFLVGNLYSVAYGDGKFVAVGSTGICHYSTTNGSSWSEVKTPWYGNSRIADLEIVYGDKGFVITSRIYFSSYNIVCYSKDGINWLAIDLGVSTILYGMTYGDGKFLSISSDVDASFVFTSEFKSYSTIISSSTNHILFSNGILLQWGKETRSGATQTVTLPYRYANSDYNCIIQVYNNTESTDGRPPLVYDGTKTELSFIANLYTAYAGFYWFTIGQGVIS